MGSQDTYHLKLNIDGAFKGKFETNGIGGVIRDSNGDWVVGCSQAIKGPTPLYIELEALCRGLELATSMQCTRIQIEIDATAIPQLIECSSPPLYNSLLCKCKYLLKMLGSPPLLHSFSEGNSIAHKLAQQGAQQESNNHIISTTTSLCTNGSGQGQGQGQGRKPRY